MQLGALLQAQQGALLLQVTRALICWFLLADAAFKKSLLSEGLDSSYRGIRTMRTHREYSECAGVCVCVCVLAILFLVL